MDKQVFDEEKIKRHISGKADEMEYLRMLFSNEKYDEELNHAFRLQWYDVLNETAVVEEKNLDHVLHKLNYEINEKEALKKLHSSKLTRWFYKAAAILLLPLLVYSGYHFFDSASQKDNAWVEINAPAWSRVQFNLPDGSKGWLNSNSSLKYNAGFLKDREVTLNGEAYFDVQHTGNQPFKVHTSDIIVTVHGTKFNIESYEDDKNVAVTLEEGKIDYYNKGMNRLYTMKPNDYICYNKESGKLKVDVVQPEKYNAWKDGKLVFRNDPLDIVAKRLGRWYNVDVQIIGNISDEATLRATFPDEKLEEVLRFLKLSLPVDYTIIKGEKTGDTLQKTKVVISSKTK